MKDCLLHQSAERINQLFLQQDIITAGIDEVSSNTMPLIRQMRKLPRSVKKRMEMIPHQEGIMSSQMSSLLFLVVGVSMALTPWLAAGGQLLASRFDDVWSLLPVESETDDLQDHIIICGFGCVGQVLHKVGAERACAAAITLDTPGANYRTVWELRKYFPNVKTYVLALDVDHGLNLEKAGATAGKLPISEIGATINEFRSRHLSKLTELSKASGKSLGYGYSWIMRKPKSQPFDSLDDNQITEGTLVPSPKDKD